MGCLDWEERVAHRIWSTGFHLDLFELTFFTLLLLLV